MRIDTDVRDIIVEIDDAEYRLAPYTIKVHEMLAAVETSSKFRHEYERQLEKLRIVMGKDAVRDLFKDGKSENITRIRMIYNGVMTAFEEANNAQAIEKLHEVTRPLAEIAAQIKPVADMVAAINGKQDKYPEIHRPN